MNRYLPKFRADVPAVFYRDHVERELPTPRQVGTNGKRLTCSGTIAEWFELLDDATYYANVQGLDFEGDPSMRGIVLSARATIKAIHAQIPDME